MSTRGRELVATDESAVVAKPVPDAIVMEDGQCDGCLANPSNTNESDRCQVFCETDDLPDQLVTSETCPWRRGR